MAYREPDVYVRREIVEQAVTPVDADLSACLFAPLYHVVEDGLASARFNALESSPQDFSWPDHKVGAVIDLGGTRDGYMDDQRKALFPWPPAFKLQDPVTEAEYDVADAYVQAVTQSGFQLVQGARTNLERADLSMWRLDVNGTIIIYRPPVSGTQGFTRLQPGDRFTLGAANHVVQSRTDTVLTPTVEPTVTSTLVEVESDGTQVVTATLGASPGRVVVTLGSSNFAAIEAGFGVGDPVVVYAPLTGFVSVAGAVLEEAGPTYVKADTLVLSATFAEADLVNRWAKIVNTTAAATYWRRVTAYNPNTLVLTFDGAIGTANNDVIAITIYDAVHGYAEAFNGTTTQVTVVLSRTFASAGTKIDLYPTSDGSIKVYPDFKVLASYREQRKDLSSQVNSAASESEFLAFVGHDSITPDDQLGQMLRSTLQAQGVAARVYYVVVDTEPAGTTGLPENQDLEAGYTAAYLLARGAEVYACAAGDQEVSAVRAAGLAHNTAMNAVNAKRERAMFTWARVPLGSLESTSGVIEPGRTANGTASSETQGNKLIRQSGAEFVTIGGVQEGTQVVITYPPEYAGRYTALGSSTDDILVLDGADWSFEKVAERTTAGLSFTTTGGIHKLTGAAAGHWRLVEPGDYLHIQADATVLRMRVNAVNAAATELDLLEEVSGDLNLTGSSLTGNCFIVRSWGSEGNGPAVEFYINPLTPQQQVDALVAAKTIVSKDVCMMLDYAPTVQVGVDESGQPVRRVLSPEVTLAAIAGLRSGNDPHQDFSRLGLGGAIESVRWGFNHFDDDQLNTLAEAGFLLIKQETSLSAPIVRDALTTNYAGGDVTSQETVTANSAWLAKSMRASLRNPAGRPLKRNSAAVAGLRQIQVASLLERYKDQERVVSYRDLVVQVNPQNKKQTTVSVTLSLPVAEKDIDISLNLEV